MQLIHCEGLVKIYRATGVEVFALQGLDLDIAAGEVVAIVGNSGSGKSTLMHVLGGLDAPSAGMARVGEWDLIGLSNRQRDAFRRQVTGFVWQNSGLNLLPYLTAVENVRLAQSLTDRDSVKEAERLLSLVGMHERRHGLPAQLSGGEQQRVALAVALANQPQLLLADEPTGSLDAAAGELVMETLQLASQELKTTVVFVTHDLEIAGHAMRAVRIRDGKVATESMRGEGEAVVVDSAGRLQLPAPVLAAAGIGRRAEVILRNDEVIVRAPR